MHCYCWRTVWEKFYTYFEYNRNMGDWTIIGMGLKDVPVYLLLLLLFSSPNCSFSRPDVSFCILF